MDSQRVVCEDVLLIGTEDMVLARLDVPVEKRQVNVKGVFGRPAGLYFPVQMSAISCCVPLYSSITVGNRANAPLLG